MNAMQLAMQMVRHSYSPMLTYMAYQVAKPVPPIAPKECFPVYADSKAITWHDYAACRP